MARLEDDVRKFSVAHISDLAKATGLTQEEIENIVDPWSASDQAATNSQTAWLAPKVVNISTLDDGWLSDPSYVYIGRPSPWGNPAKITAHSRQQCISMFEDYARSSAFIQQNIGSLSGKLLVCYCKPLPCHGDILVKLFNCSFPI